MDFLFLILYAVIVLGLIGMALAHIYYTILRIFQKRMVSRKEIDNLAAENARLYDMLAAKSDSKEALITQMQTEIDQLQAQLAECAHFNSELSQ